MKPAIVSIVVPIYNVQEYLGVCIESLLRQTFKDIEILLIDDGSTDNSLEICNKFKQNDARIQVFHKENEGLGPTRNYGVEQATGKYILFVDPDDWLREDSVELLYTEAEKMGAEVVYFDFVLYMQNEGRYIRSYENQEYLECNMFVEKKLNNCMLPSVCTAMYLLEKWRERKILFPATLFEDNAVYPLILLEFKKYVILPEGLYFYRTNCRVTITSNHTNHFFKDQPLSYLISEIKNRGYFRTYQKGIFRFCYNQLEGALRCIRKNLSEDDYINAIHKFNIFLRTYFNCTDQFYNKDFIYMGSYSIGRIGNNIFSQNINECRFNFFSLISLMTDKYEKFELNCDAEYKKLMFRKECRKDILSVMKRKPHKYLVFDLLEERYPLVKTINGSYYTGTGVLRNYLRQENIKGYSIIENESAEYDQLWEECCLRFIDFCKVNFDTTHLVMVRTLLADSYGNEEKQVYYSNKNQIQKINRKLSKFYDYFAKQCPGIIDIIPEEDNYYTDINFRYGCVPEHLNNMAYKSLADRVMSEIEKRLNIVKV